MLTSTTSSLDPGTGAFGDPGPLLLGNPRGDGEHQFPGRAGRAEVRLGVRLERHAVRREPADVLERLEHPLAGEPIERPRYCRRNQRNGP